LWLDGLDRIATENRARVDAGADLAVLIAGFQALVARRTVAEWQAVLDAVQNVPEQRPDPRRERRANPAAAAVWSRLR